MRITGTQINYYFFCKRQLWLFSHRVEMEPFSDEVLIGKLIHKFSYSREKDKEKIRLQEAVMDLLKVGKKTIIQEIKKSESNLEGSKWQVIYYAYLLNKKGLKVDEGMILIPKKFRRHSFKITEKEFKEMEKILKNVEFIVNSPTPPQAEKKPPCRKCAYREFCWG